MKLPEKLGVSGMMVSLLGIFFGWVLFPWLLKKQIGQIKGLAPGSETREFWEKIPFPIVFKVYLFNVTNPEAIHKGEAPELKEIGPYYYDEIKEKAEILDIESEDAVTFHMKNTYYYNKEKTLPLTGDETVIIPHPLIMGIVLAAERNKPGVLGMVNKAVEILFNQPEHIFLKTTVQDLLYGGILINCTTKDFSAAAICAVLKRETTDLEHLSPTVSKFTIFKLKNGTNDPSKLEVNRGILEPQRVGEVLKVNDKKKLSTWRGRPCNNLEGTDSTIFPPIANTQDDIVSFNVELCRSIGAKYVGPSTYKSISTYRYNVSLGDMSSDPSLKCLCFNDTICYKKGVMDILKCTGAPIVASLPHFYDAHEDYLKGVKGLNPNPNDHSIILDIEPVSPLTVSAIAKSQWTRSNQIDFFQYTGTPMYARKRIQFSFPIHKVNKVEVTQNLPDILLPFIWVEESIDLPDHLVQKIQTELFLIIKIVDVVKWSLTVLGAAIMSGGVGLYYKRQNSLPITPTSSAGKKFGSTDYLSDKKTSSTELGHTNLGYM